MNRFLLITAALLAAGLMSCGDDDGSRAIPTPNTTTTATNGPGSSTPMPTALSNLPGDVAAAIQAAKASDGSSLRTLLATVEGPCVVAAPPGIIQPPRCPAGAAAGMLVPALVFGGCPDEFRFVDSASDSRVTGFDGDMLGGYLIGVVELHSPPLRYAALFGFEKVGWLGFDATGRLIGAGGGGDCPAFGLRSRLATNDWLDGPRWSD